MRSKSIILLVLALGCGLVASIGISQYMEARHKATDQGDRQPVFVAMTDINANEEMTAQNIKLEEWPKNIIPAGALTKLEEVEHKRCRMKLYAGEPILSSKLLGASDAIGAAKDIPPGYRVVHVKVDAATGSSNLILPGDRVDVVVFRQPNNNMNATAAKIVLQDIKVFAVDTQTENQFAATKSEQTEPISAKTIAVLVTPEQAVILHAATEMGGSVRLVLRNPDDNMHVVSQGATLSDIFGPDHASNRDAEKSPQEKEEKTSLTDWLNKQKGTGSAAPPAAPSRKMIVMLGSQLTEVDIPGNGEPPTNQPVQSPSLGGSSSGGDTSGDDSSDDDTSADDGSGGGDVPVPPEPNAPTEESEGSTGR
jgi:pilus assembly protein CpaB